MKVIYMGTPDFAVGALEAIIEAGHEVLEVVTQPDKPKGRSGALSPSPVKECALSHNIPVFQPVKIKEASAVAHLKELDADIYVVAAFGQILSQEILDIPRFGCINIHASLLPKYRGASPIQAALLEGDPETGVTIMQMNAGMDTGDILFMKTLEITREDNAETLFDRLSALGASMAVKVLPMIERGEAKPIPQKEELATYTKKITKEMGWIRWERSASELQHLIQGMTPWPSAYTRMNGKILKIWKAYACEKSTDAEPGTIIEVTKDRILVQTGQGSLEVLELQLEGKKRMAAADFIRGHQIQAGVCYNKA